MTTEGLHQEEMDSEKLRLLGFLLRKALESASRGAQLTADEREMLSQWLSGEKWYAERPSSGSDEAKLIKAQVMLLGPELRKALANAASDGQLTRDDKRELREWLYATRRLQRRYQRRRQVYFLIYTVAIFAACLFIRPYVPVGGLPASPLWIPFIIAVAVLIGAIVKDVYLDRNVETALSDIKWTTEKTKEDIRDILEKDLRPRVIALDSPEKVLRVASDILLEAIQEKENRFVIFIGAASLSTLKLPQLKTSDEDKLSPVDEYNTRLVNLEGSRIPVKRYISLIKSGDFHSRKTETIRDYLGWFDKQIGLLKDNPKYTLVDCPRAQPWGGSRSSIITHKAFLDIIGEGRSGFLIKSEEVARALKEGSERLFATVNQHTYRGGEESTVQKLRTIHNELKSNL